MDLTNIADVRTAMKLAGIRANKGLGQHFLVNRDSLEAIIAAAAPTPGDVVLEVGPGLGVMTRELTRRAASVISVELDQVLADLLRRDAPANLRVVESDILKYDLHDVPAGYKVIANIPYYLTSKLIRLLVESDNPPTVMSLLIQKEVAERIVAKPGQMSMLSLSVQFYGRPGIAAIVPREHFYPAPDVDSAVLRIELTGPAFDAEPQKLFRLMKAGFGEKRKQLKNSLAGGLGTDGDTVLGLLAVAGLKDTARAQELSLDDWHRLYDAALAAGLLA